jgi:hypothetical protein
MSGFGLIAIFDSNQDGKYGNGDFYSFSAGCGPYTNLAGIDAPSPQANPGYTGYNYGTCVEGAFGGAPGGVVPNWLGAPLQVLLGDFFDVGGPCAMPVLSGNLKISVAVDWSSGPTGPPPN